MGKISFAHIEDGAGKVQLFLRANEVGPEKLDFFNRMFDIGDFIQASGIMFRTKTGEVTLQVHDFTHAGQGRQPAARPTRMRRCQTAPSSGTRGWKIRNCAPASATPTWRSTPMCARSSARARGCRSARCASSSIEHGFLEVETPDPAAALRRRGGAAVRHASQRA